MKPIRLPAILIVATLLLPLVARAQPAEAELMEGVTQGPATARMESVAEIQVPAHFIFLDGERTRQMLRSYGEPVSGQEMGMLTPTNAGWSVFFDFNDIGFVKDDDKDELNPDKLLKAIRAGNEEGNKERRRNGVAPLNLIGWEQEPKYDPVTHNLEWAIRFESEGRAVLNYNTRLLGRKGVMSVVLVVDPDELQATLPAFRDLLAGHSYQSGESYAEYRPGDKVAKYGLAALVVGGAAVGAAKLGLFAWLAVFLKKGWKLIVIGAAAVAAMFRKLFLRKTDGPQA